MDGQQRIATFTLLVAALINLYKRIYHEIEADPLLNNQKGILKVRIDELSARYVSFKMEVKDNFQDINVLELSNRDKAFFNSFLSNPATAPQRESHKLIKSAYEMISQKVDSLTHSGNLRDRIGNLKTVELILDHDFCLLSMVTGDRKSAFKLFQVLNNRGKNLTEGDLLRAESLRLLEAYPANQTAAEEAWDNILVDQPIHTERFLRAIYGSYKGQKAGTNSLFNEFLTSFIPEYEYENIEAGHANTIRDKVKDIEKDVAILRKLNAGTWPYEHGLPVEHWDRNRLYLLIHALDHIECLPFLLSARLLDHREFSKIVQVLERFVFRYLIVGNQYIGDLIAVYHEEAKLIRDNPAGYTVANLKQKLQPLMDKVNDDMFKRHLEDLKYHRTGRSNKALKYFLLSVEYYDRWIRAGGNGNPECMEKQRVYDFSDSTIEHVYPYSATGATLVQDLESLKNGIGNLTILGNTDNRTGENDDFLTKKPIYQASSLAINRDQIGTKPAWTKDVVEARLAEMKNHACLIFKL